MSMQNRRVLVGICGGIAAYKAVDLVRRLCLAGAEVQVVMTASSQDFIRPLSLQAASGNEVHTDLLDPRAEAAMGHIELARWADAVLVAPATADFMARMASGRGDDLLSTLCLATSAPIHLAPAMNQAMWRNSATAANLATLRQRGANIHGPATGQQACGDIGPGRMLEPQQLADALAASFDSRLLEGRRVLITAGPTRELIDPVRYISNLSSGKMGYALARAAADAGAAVQLVSGPVHLPVPERSERISVMSALQMRDAVMERITACDIFIATAAVADYRASQVAKQKIKKPASGGDKMSLQLVRNPDILAEVAALGRAGLFVVGFAAETQNLQKNATTKLHKKGADLIVANDVCAGPGGFGSDENAATLLWADGTSQHLQLMAKTRMAAIIVERLAEQLAGRSAPATPPPATRPARTARRKRAAKPVGAAGA